MVKNMGNIDRTIRIIVGLVLVGLFIGKITSGVFGIILAIVGLANIVFSFIGSCPVYPIFGWSTFKTKS